jgi:hypothetical protein
MGSGRSKGFGLVQFPNDFIGWLLDRQCNRDGGRALN